MRTVADGLVSRLGEWGTKRIFGFAGDGVDPLLGALRRAEAKIELVTARHEEMAAFMATGHAKYTGQVGVCLATQGPGAIHLLNGLYDAKLDRQPVVAIIGQVTSTALGSGYQQEVDLHTLFKDVCGQYVQAVTGPDQMRMVVDNAFRTAIATSSPTCVIVPHDVQAAELPGEVGHEHGLVPTAPVTAHPHVVPIEADLEKAAAVLNAGRRVALLIGQGAYGAQEELITVAERLGAGITSSLLGKPVLQEGLPYHCGVMGHLGTTASADLMAGCDTLLIVGSKDPWTEYYPAPGQARAVQIDIAPQHLGVRYPVEVALAGDAKTTLRALLPLLHSPTQTWRDDVLGMVSAWREVAAARMSDHPGSLNPQAVVGELTNYLPFNARVAVDVGSVTYWYGRFLRLPADVPAHLSSTLASMGSAMPYALAAKLDRPDLPVFALAGDGAMQMNGLSELITVASRWQNWQDPRFVVLVLNNGDLAEVSWEQREMEGEPRFPTSQEVPAFPYADYAELLGLHGTRVTKPEQIAGAWEHAVSCDRPCLIEAIVDADTPLLPPRQPKEKMARTHHGLEQENNMSASRLLDMQRQQEQSHGG